MKDLNIIKNDPWLEPYKAVIENRYLRAEQKEKDLPAVNNTLGDFANGHFYYGIQKTVNGWILREWAPNATKIFVTGEFSEWKENPEYELSKKENGNWEIELKENQLKHKDLYKLSVHWNGGQAERIPAWTNRVVQDENTLVFNAQVWFPEKAFQWKNDKKRKEVKTPLIYEAHIGMATEEERVGTYNEFRINMLPRIKKAGYNVIQLMAIQEHPYYGSFGYHVSNYFAASSRFGTPDELKALIDEAHELEIMVIMDMIHSHAVKNEIEGIARFDGTRYQYFHEGSRGEHVAWDSLCFNYEKNEVLHFLFSNIKFWLDEYHFDGYRFDGVTSMLYLDHGLSRAFTNYDMYFDGSQDEGAITYFILANKLIHEINPNAITVAEEMSGYPGIATKIEDGGLGFDYRLAMGVPDYWIKTIKEKPDENWDVRNIFHELANKRADEKTICYAESHDQALVGDKTIIFRLIDKEMYWHMNKTSENLIVDRGIALHKMIRLVTLATAGNGYLNFMGNEFGHPEWIDFPREGNNWSFKHARRQWNLVNNNDLRYEYLNNFDRAIIELVNSEKYIEKDYPQSVLENDGDQVLVFKRSDLVFVFNFNPSQSFTDYGIPIYAGKFKIILNSDDPEFGGFSRVDNSIVHFTSPVVPMSGQHQLKLYLPNRTALVLKHIPTKKVKYTES